MDAPLAASLISGGIDIWEYAAQIAPPADVSYLAAMDVDSLYNRYLKDALEAMLAGQVLHAQHERVFHEIVEDNKHLKEFLQAREDAFKAKEGDLGVMRTNHEDLVASLKQEQENHQATIATLVESHVVALNEAEEAYKRSTMYKEDVMNYMCDPEAVKEFLGTKESQEAIEAEAQLASDIGMSMQQQIYPCYTKRFTDFDPVAMGLPKVIEENGDPEANKDVEGAVITNDEPISPIRSSFPIADLFNLASKF